MPTSLYFRWMRRLQLFLAARPARLPARRETAASS